VNCSFVGKNLLDYADGNSTEETMQAVEKHLERCAHCKNRLATELRIQHSLRNSFTHQTTEQFKDNLFFTIEQQASLARRWFNTGFSSAVAAGLFAWALFSVFIHASNYGNTTEEIHLPLNIAKIINIAIETPANFNQVTMTIEVPSHIEIDGFPNENRISWNTTLNSGKNLLSLPLKLKENYDGYIIAKISDGTKDKAFRFAISKMSS